jgi:hypothetical protein
VSTTEDRAPDDLLTQVREAVKAVLRSGARPSRLADVAPLLCLDCVRSRLAGDATPLNLSFAAEQALKDAAAALGDGPYGHATCLLLGLDAESRGLPLKTRRRLAGEELEVLPSTFRRLYEDQILDDLAVELIRLQQLPIVQRPVS